MPELDSQLKAIDALVQIHSAIKNVQSNSSVNPAMTHSIETLYLHLLDMVRQNAPAVFARLEKQALAEKTVSDRPEEGTIPVAALMDIFSGLGVKSVSFDRDRENEELNMVVKLLAESRKPVQAEAELPPLEAESKPETVQPDHQTYITLEKHQEILPGHETAKSQISKSIAAMQKVFVRMNALEGSIGAIPSDETMEMIERSSNEAARWIEEEAAWTPGDSELYDRLEILLQDFISNGFFAEAISVINALSKINNGTLKKDDKMRDMALSVLRNLASDNNIDLLFREIRLNEKNKKDEACRIFAGFGGVVIEKLLEALRKASDSKARISILHILEEMGPGAVPAIKASINMNAPWYYLRNMAYILGRIGNATSVDVLKILLLHKEKRVRKEAFKSIGLIGGNTRGPLLLSVLPQVDQELRVAIIETLGKIKYAEAVTDLQSLLKSRSSMAKDEQTAMQEKICAALGAIGSPEAIKTLTEIAETKSILGMGAYSKEVKHAAERALSYIRRK